MNNPTYELDNGTQDSKNPLPARAHQNSSSLLAILEQDEGGGVKVYEAIEEPINEEELNLEDQEPHNALPYAVHFYPGDGQYKDTPKPVVFKKSNKLTKNSKAGSDECTSGFLEHKKNVKKKPPIPSKPPVTKSPVHGAMLQLDSDPRGAYSELDMKTSYASLEPHIGENTGITVMIGESYSHLNR